MVTFRFYVVSAVVFFLALAVGVVIGSALGVGDATRIEEGLTEMETKLDATVERIDEKNEQIDELERYTAESAPFAVASELVGAATMVVAEPGLNVSSIEDLSTRMVQSGARHLGSVTLTDRWMFAQDNDAEDLAAVLESAGIETSELEPGDLRTVTWNAVFGVGDANAPDSGGADSNGGESSNQTGDPENSGDPESPGSDEEAGGADTSAFFVDLDLLGALGEAGFVSLSGLSEGPSGDEALAVALVTGADSSLVGTGDGIAVVLPSVDDAGAATVVAEVATVNDGPPERGSQIDQVRSVVEVEFSSVDNLDEPAGAVAVVLALAERLRGGIGNYGFGPGANSTLPLWSAE